MLDPTAPQESRAGLVSIATAVARVIARLRAALDAGSGLAAA